MHPLRPRSRALWPLFTGLLLLSAAPAASSGPILRATLGATRLAGGVSSLDFSPDGRRLAAGLMDSRTAVYDAVTGNQLALLEGRGEGVVAVGFGPGGERLATAGRRGTVWIWDLSARKVERRFQAHLGAVRGLRFLKGSGRLVSCGDDGQVVVWDAASGGKDRVLARGEEPWVDLASSPGGRFVAAAGASGHLAVWDLSGVRARRTIAREGGLVHSLALSPGGELLAAGEGDGGVRLWRLPEGEPLARLEALSDPVTSLGFWGKGGELIAASREGGAGLVRCDIAAGRVALRFRIEGRNADALACSADGRSLATGGGSQVTLWDPGSGEPVLCLPRGGHQSAVRALAVTERWRWVATGGEDGTVCLWDPTTGFERARLRHGQPVSALAFAPGGRFLAAAGGEGLRFWALPEGRPAGLVRHEGWLGCLAFLPDGERLVAGGLDGVLLWVGIRSAAVEGSLDTGQGEVRGVCVSPGGGQVATAGRDGTVRLWELRAGEGTGELGAGGAIAFAVPDRVTSLAWAPGGDWIAAGALDGTVVLWNPRSQEILCRLELAPARPRSLAASARGLLAAACDDGRVRVWRPPGVEPVAEIECPGGRALAVCFFPESGDLAVGMEDATGLVWSLGVSPD